jgi:alkylhydroperoxidase family enzyme
MARISYFDYDNAPADAQAFYDEELRKTGGVSNMKRTLLQSAPVFRAYREWYNLRDEVVAFLGRRAFDIFAHAISSQNGCLLCSTYFRKALADIGLSPDTFIPTDDEQLLIEAARQIVDNKGAVSERIWSRLQARYAQDELVKLIGFAGLMVATNLFNSVIEVDLDDALLPHATLPETPERSIQV